jgi:hypothetical protein
LTADRKVPR